MLAKSNTNDARRRDPFKKPEVLVVRYERQLRSIAREVGRIVKGFDIGTERAAVSIRATLNKYAELLQPWAEATAARMASDLDRQDRAIWNRNAREMSLSLRKELNDAPVGTELQRFLHDNVKLITSLPREEGERVHELTIEGLANSSRARTIAGEIMRTGEVTEGRAMLIARTETSRTASVLTQVRSESIGSDGYVWHTVGDSDVRPRHKKLNGKVFKWSSPPIAGENGERAHAGQIYNCRCYPEPIIPELDE